MVGGGPAGLAAAEALARSGLSVVVHDRMRVVGRKFVMAGRGGLNLTNDEPLDVFLGRYGDADLVVDAVRGYPPSALRAWAASLGEPTFVGTSRRVFPGSMNTTPLLRAWLQRLHEYGVRFERVDVVGVEVVDGVEFGRRVAVRIRTDGHREPAGLDYDAVVLAMGGASWPRLGADGAWVKALRGQGVAVEALVASNCGIVTAWPAGFAERFAGEPLKNIEVTVADRVVRGEAMVTVDGLEGGVIYALGREVRRALASTGSVELSVDLRPDVSLDDLTRRFARSKTSESLSNRLRKVGLTPVGAALVRNSLGPAERDPNSVAMAVKSLKLIATGTVTVERAISSAGGIALGELDDRFMLRRLPGVFAAGEMLDWDAPTGGYLLQACFATGVAAAEGAVTWLAEQSRG